MATLLVNLSGGVLHLPQLNATLTAGGRLELPLKADEVKAMCPEVALFEKRGRLLVSEDAEVEPVAAPAAPAPAPVEPAPVEPAAHEASAAHHHHAAEPEAPALTDSAPADAT